MPRKVQSKREREDVATPQPSAPTTATGTKAQQQQQTTSSTAGTTTPSGSVASASVTHIHQQSLEIALVRSEGALERWRRQTDKSKYQPHRMMSALGDARGGGCNASTDDDIDGRPCAVVVGGALRAALQHVGTIEVIFNEGKEALLVEHAETVTATLAAPTASLPDDNESEVAAAVRSDASPATWFVGDVILFEASTHKDAHDEGQSGGLQAAATWVGYNLAAVKDATDRVDAALAVVQTSLWPFVLKCFSAKPGMAQLTAFVDDSTSWTRLLQVADGTTLPNLLGPLMDKARRPSGAATSSSAGGGSSSVAALEGHLHALAYLTACALVSLHDGCVGMHHAVTRTTYEFIASPLFVQFLITELDDAAQVNLLIHVVGANASTDVTGESRVNEVAALLQLFAECVWVPHAAQRYSGVGMHHLWAHAADALAAAMHMLLRRASSDLPAEQHSGAASSPLNASRLVRSRGFLVAADLFVAWVQSTSARGSAFIPGGHNRGGSTSSGGGLLDAFLVAPTGWAQWASWGERGGSGAAPSAAAMRQLPALGERQQTSNIPAQLLTSATAIFQDASLARLCTLRRVYSQLYTPLAKALRCVFAEQGARRHDIAYAALRYAVVDIDTEQPVLARHDAPTALSGDDAAAWRLTRHGIAVAAFTQAPCVAVPIAERQEKCLSSIRSLFGFPAAINADLWAHVVPAFFARSRAAAAGDVHDAVDSVLACVVVEMNEETEPFAFPCLCQRQPRPPPHVSSTMGCEDSATSVDASLPLTFLNGNTDAVCALLQAVGDARRTLIDVSTDSSCTYPRAAIVFADEMPATDDAVVATRNSALAKLRYLHHLVMVDEQSEITDATRYTGLPQSSSSGAAPPPVPGAQAASASIFSACCGSVKATGQLPIASARRAASQVERDAMRRASKSLPDMLSATIPDVLRGGGITECLGNAVVSGVSGLHMLEGVVGSGKSVAALLVAAVHGVGRRESREEFRQHQTSVLEHISYKAATTAATIAKEFSSAPAKGQPAVPSMTASGFVNDGQHHPHSDAVSDARRSALRDLIRVRHQQLEEFNRCRQGFLVRNPVGILENVGSSCASMGLLSMLRRQYDDGEGGAEDNRSVAPPRHGWLEDIRDSGAARVARSPYVQRLQAKVKALMASRRYLLALDAQMMHADDGTVVLRGPTSHLLSCHSDAHHADRLYPLAMGILFRAHGDGLLSLSCNGTTLDEALRAAFGTHRVLLHVPDLSTPPPSASSCLPLQDGGSGNDNAIRLDLVPTPQHYKASSTTKGLFERAIASAPQGSGSSRGGAGVWASGAHNHHNLMELQRQLLRAALHNIEQELLWVAVLRDEASDYVAAFEASQLHDVLVLNEASCIEALPVLRGHVGPRAFRGSLELSGLVVDGLDSLRDDPLHILPTSAYVFASMSLERVASLDEPLSWGGGAAMAEHLRLRMLQLAAQASSGGAVATPAAAASGGGGASYTTSSSRLSECIRLLNAEVTSATTMLLPQAVLGNRSTVTAATVHLNARRQGNVPFWRRNAALWCPSIVSDNDNNSGGGGDPLSDVVDASSTAAVVTAVLPSRVATEVYLACLLASEMQRYHCQQQQQQYAQAEGVQGQQHVLLTVAVVVPSLAMIDVQVALDAFRRAEGAGSRNDATRSDAVVVGDLTTLTGRCFDMLVVVPCTTAHGGRHVGGSSMWLWRVATRARRGFVVVTSQHSTTIAASSIASRPVDATLMLFRKYLAEALSVPKAEDERNMGDNGTPLVGTPEYRDAQLDVATLRRKNPFDTLRFHCPDHHVAVKILTARSMERRTRRHNDRGGSNHDQPAASGTEEVLQLVTDGADECQAICMQRFLHCEHPAHRCVRTCHVYRRPTTAAEDEDEAEGGNEAMQQEADDDALHACCPYPCPKTLSCGHRCLATCGVACPPCAFEGWVELSCGQMVVSGMNGKEVQHTVFPHHQWLACGAVPEACTAEVTLSCPRCGGKVRGPCADASNSADWPCAQCDAEAKKIRAEFSIREESAGGGSVADEAEIAASMWPQAATEKFEKQLSFLRQKGALLEKRLALEVAAKGVDRNPEHVAEEKRVHAIRVEQEENEAQWRQKSADAKTEWAGIVKHAVDDQRRWNDHAEVIHRQVIEALMHAA